MMMSHVEVISVLLCFISLSHAGTLQQVVSHDVQEHRDAMRFLLEHMPEPDQPRISTSYLRTNVRLALAARKSRSWSRAVPWDVFLNNVLPYANLDEPRDDWRILFSQALSGLVKDAKSSTEAAQILNRDVWSLWGIVFKADQTPEIMSPSQVIHAGYASCTGLSIFLANACRAVGIPARVAGTPSWVTSSAQHAQRDTHGLSRDVRSYHSTHSMHANAGAGSAISKSMQASHTGTPLPAGGGLRHDWNNHNWVEVWDSGVWSFIGAAEYDARGMNRTWFFPDPAKKQIPGSPLHAIYAASWAATQQCNTTFPLVWDSEWSTPGCDVTQAYLDAEVLD